MQMVLDRYGVVLKQSGQEVRGNCPIHKGSNNKHFTVNVSKNVFKCFFESCGVHGNVLDFVAAMECCSVREAAIKLSEWFRIGESRESSKQSDVRREKIEIKKGIYSDDEGAMYEVIGTATQVEDSGFLVVYRELFGQYNLLAVPLNSFREKLGPLGQSHFVFVREL